MRSGLRSLQAQLGWLTVRLVAGVVMVGMVVVVPLLLPAAAAPTPEGAAQRFFERYVDDDGRVVRRDQGGDTVSEGQAYGMLLAVAQGERERFASVWQWAQDNLQREDGLLSWHWSNGQIADPEPAADADLDAAWALTLAADRFNDPSYRDEAARIATAILDQETVGHRAGCGARRGSVGTYRSGGGEPQLLLVPGVRRARAADRRPALDRARDVEPTRDRRAHRRREAPARLGERDL